MSIVLKEEIEIPEKDKVEIGRIFIEYCPPIRTKEISEDGIGYNCPFFNDLKSNGEANCCRDGASALALSGRYK